MKSFTQKLSFLLLALLCCVGIQVRAEELTVLEDATSTTGNVPVYGTWTDNPQHTQSIYSADLLQEMTGGSITSMKFYMSGTSSKTSWRTGGGTFDVSLAITTQSDLSSAWAADQLTTVYSGVVDASGTEMVITFSDPFVYTGGNLLLDVQLPSAANDWEGANFYCASQSASVSRYCYGTGCSGSAITQLPKVTFEYTSGSGGGPVCDKPSSLTATEIGSKSVSLAWEGGSNTYDVGYKGPGENDYTYYERNTTATNFTFTGLQPNASYSFAVKSKCAEGESQPRTVSVKTAIAIPYEENFDALSAIPSDWKQYTGLLADVLSGSASLVSTTYGWSFLSGTTGVFGSKHIYTNIYGTSRKNWLVLPSISMEGNAILTFNVALSGSSSSSTNPGTGGSDDKFAVVISTDEGATWTTLQLWDNAGSPYVYNNIAKEGQEVSIDLSVYAGLSVQIAFYGESTTSNADNYLHIDDVLIDFGRSCLKPTGLKEVAGKATKSSVQIAWDEDANADAWKVQYKKSADTDWITVDANVNPFSIEGLEAYTDYNVRVAALCDASDETSLTRYCKEITVKTAAGVPYHEGFSHYSVPSDWKRYDISLDAVVNGGEELVAATSGWSEGSKNGIFPDSTYHLYLNTAGAECHKWIVSPSIEMEDGYELSFDLALTKSAGGAVKAGDQENDMFAVLVFDGEDWNIAAQWTNTGAGYAYDEINATANGQIIKIDLSSYKNTNVQIAFYGESTDAESDNNLHISNVSIAEIPDCAPALSLSIDDIGVTSATAQWTAQADGGQWAYGYVANPAANFAPAATDYLDTIALKVFAMSELTANTEYAFFVRHICDGDAASDPVVRTFKTFPSPKTVPWTENFNAAGFPEFWDNSEGTTTSASFRWSKYLVTVGDSCLRFNSYSNSNGNTNFLATPRIDLSVAAILSFDWKNPAGGAGEVLISTDNGVTKTSLLTSGLTGVSDWTNFEINLSAYMGQIVTLYFKGTSNYGNGDAYLYLDNVKIDVAPDCIKPSGLEISEIGSESATATWTDDNDGYTWVYACLPATEAEPAGEAMTPVTQNSLIIGDLTEKTNYVFYLRKQCGEGFSASISAAFKTDANPFAMPFVENFNDLESGIPEGWNNAEGTMTTASYRWNYYATGYEGAGLRMNSYNPSSGLYSILATPKIVLSEPALLSFQWKNPAGGAAEIFIAGKDGQRISLKNSGMTGVTEWQLVEINLSDYTNDTVTIFFKGISNCGYNDAYLYLDDVKVEALPSCMKPTDLAVVDGSITTTSVQLAWNAGLNETAWSVQYKKQSEEEWETIADATNPFTLDGLDPATVYDVKVAAQCEEEEISDYSDAISFVTECEAITLAELPFKEGFDSITGATSSHVMPLCWSAINTCTYSSYKYYPTVYASASYANTPDNSLRFYSTYSTYTDYDPQDQYAILPEIDATISDLRIKLNARKYSSSYNADFTIGVMTDASDTSTFVAVATLSPSADTYEAFVVPFDTYAGEGKFIAIKFAAATSAQTSRYVHIDDIVVEEIPSCLEVSALAVLDTTITTTSAEVRWTAGGAETAWLVQYKKAAEEEWLEIDAQNDTVPLSGLVAATKYEVRVAAKCSDTEVSPFCDAISFYTACDVYTMPFVENFNDLTAGIPICWDNEEGTVTTASYKWNSYETGHEGKGLRFNSYSATKNQTNYLKTPVITVNEAAVLSFWFKNPTGGDFSIFYSVDGNENDTLAEGLTAVSAWTLKEIMLPDTCVGRNIEVIFKGTSNYGSGDAYIYLDDVKIDAVPACLKPENLAVSNIANHSVQLSWTAQNEETAWSVQYKKQGEEEWTTVPADANPFVLEGLDAATAYEVQVAAQCGDAVSEYTQKIGFVTECDAISEFPYEENFDGMSAAAHSYGTPSERVLPICWSAINTCTYSTYKYYPTVYYYSSYPAYANSADNALRFYSYSSSSYDPQDQYAILPEMEGISGLRMKFNARAYSTSYDADFYVGVMSDPNDASTFVEVAHLEPAGTDYEPFVVKFNSYEGEGKYIAVKMAAATGSYNYRAFFIDDVRVEELPNCLEPEAAAVTYNGGDSVVISWTSEATAWNIDVNGTLVPVTTNPFTLKELSYATNYTVKVQAICGEEVSDWSNEVSFATEICAAENQMPISYTITDQYQDGWNGASIKVVHKATSVVAAQLSVPGGQQIYNVSGTLNLCCGEEYSFVWVSGNYDGECSFVFKDLNGATILSHSQGTTIAAGELLAYTMVCPACMQPTDLIVSDITPVTASVQWTPGKADQTAWQIAYDTLVSNQPDTLPTFTEVTAAAYALGALLPEHTYHIYVRANCGEEDGVSEWSHVSFATASLCQKPDGLEAKDIAETSAAIHWTTYGQTGFNLRYGTDGTNWTVVENAAMPCTISELASNTSYKVQVQAACAAEEENSWSATYTFKTACGLQAIPFTEDFESGIDCWTIESDRSGTGLGTTAYEGSKSFVFAYGYSDQFVISPELDAIDARLEIEFKYKNSYTTETFHVGYSTTSNNLETDFTWGDEISASSQTWTSYVDTLPAGVKYVAIKYTSYDEYYLYIDNFSLSRLSNCAKPSDLTVGDVFAHSAELSWTAGDENQTAWDIALDTIAAFKPDTLSAYIAADANPFVLTGLIPQKRYYAYVRGNCGEEVSKWSNRVTFMTTVACPAPTGLAAQLTAGNGSIATLNWNAGDAQAWQVEYSLHSDMTDSIVLNVTEPVANLTGLTAEATYYARVKADCGELDGESAYSAIISFTPSDKYELLLNDGATTTNRTYVPIEGSYVDEGTRSQFIIPEADLAEIEWDSIMALTFYGEFASTTRTTWGDAEWEVYVTEAPETTMSALVDWNAMTQVKAAAKLALVDGEMVVAFDEPYQYQGGNLMIGIYQTTNGAWANVNWFGVNATGASFGGHGNGSAVSQRNFLPKMAITYVPGQVPACPNPKQLAVSNITDSEATFSWKAFAGANWEYALVEGAAAPESFEQTDLNSITIDELAEATQYTFYLRRACGEDGNSEMIHVAFTTDIHVAAIPFNDDFEGANYWKFVALENTNAWTIGNATSNGGDNAMYVSNNGNDYAYNSEETSASFATVLLHFETTGDYTIDYDWKGEGDYDDDDVYDFMRVGLVPAAATVTAGIPTLPEDFIALDNGALYGQAEWQHVRLVFQVEAAGDYKLLVAWINDEADGETPGAIDNIAIISGDAITGIEGNAGFENKAVKFIQNDHVYILINGVIYDVTGRKVGVK